MAEDVLRNSGRFEIVSAQVLAGRARSLIDYSDAMWRTWLSIALAGFVLSRATAQKNLWLHASNPNRKGIQRVTPPPSERQSIARLLSQWACDGETDWSNKLAYSLVPLSSTARVLLIESGPGCLRGGQGSNGGMWLVASDGSDLILLADPERGFNGFLYSIEPTSNKGYRDVILGWHRGGGETGLDYFRFDGTAYRSVDGAVLSYDEDRIPKITDGTQTGKPGLALQPSFDCADAMTATEKLVCSDAELAELDRAMAYAYRRAQGMLPGEGRNALRNDQLEWLKSYARACDFESSGVARKKCASQFLRSRAHELSLRAQ
jgi:uncharacterized protein YecT (DUF1311 family)